MSKKYLLSLFLFVVTAYSSLGQAKVSGADEADGLDLRDCIDYAIEHNLTLQQNRLNIENSLVKLNQSKGNRLPTVNAQTNLNSNYGRNIDPFSNQIVTKSIGTNSLGLGASYVIYNGMKLKNTVLYNEMDLQAAQKDLEAQKNTISIQVSVSYLNVLSAEDMIEVAQKNVDVTQLQLERTRKLVAAGSLPETDVFNLEAQLANDELQLVNAENQHASAFFSLKQNMNYTGTGTFNVVRVDIPKPSLSPYPESVEQVYQAAIDFLPEVEASEIREEMAARNIEIAKAAGLPTLSANASWGTTFSTAAKTYSAGETTYEPISVSAEYQGQTVPLTVNFPQQSTIASNIPYFDQLNNNKNLNVGISLQIPIFNGFNRKYQIQSAKIQEMQSQVSTQNTKLTIRQNIEQAYINMLNSAKTYSANLVQVDAQQKAFNASQASFNAGASNFVDYNIAKSNLDRANANLIQSKYDYLFRIKILDFYQNKPLSF
ncbi:TolC family protein [Marinilongibacter aquaticus]|uniref:TolC family protein n=1 Tax=Marinilongibacter aquaticus TaxID=2975157 RepID=UPI0021BDC644|nr:TolC family protein [Marinilongibacter aquaticus]UBM60902.1 TolC family protein [Marinilongibacter aquaticus]